MYAVTLSVLGVREAWKGGHGRVNSLVRSMEVPAALPAAPLLLLPILGCQWLKLRASRNLIMFAVSLIVLASSTICVSVTLAVVQEKSLIGFDSRLRGDLIDMYGHESANNHSNTVFTQAMDYAQYTFQCCGVKGDSDYLLTKWFVFGATHGHPRLVPPSCCVPETQSALNNLEEGWQKPQPKHETSCQSKEIEEFASARNRKGCIRHIEVWVRQEIAFSCMVAGSIVILEIFGVFLTMFLRSQITLMEEEERNKPDA